jgi:hypothetical protein
MPKGCFEVVVGGSETEEFDWPRCRFLMIESVRDAKNANKIDSASGVKTQPVMVSQVAKSLGIGCPFCWTKFTIRYPVNMDTTARIDESSRERKASVHNKLCNGLQSFDDIEIPLRWRLHVNV